MSLTAAFLPQLNPAPPASAPTSKAERESSEGAGEGQGGGEGDARSMLRQWVNENKGGQKPPAPPVPAEPPAPQPQRLGGGEQEQAVRGKLEVRCRRADGLPKMVGSYMVVWPVSTRCTL